jgi:hypothetical protein
MQILEAFRRLKIVLGVDFACLCPGCDFFGQAVSEVLYGDIL